MIQLQLYNLGNQINFVRYVVIGLLIGVLTKKIWRGDKVLPKFCDICSNHDFQYFTDRTEKLSEILG